MQSIINASKSFFSSREKLKFKEKQRKLIEILKNIIDSPTPLEFSQNLDNLKLFLLSEAETDLELTTRLVNEGLHDYQMLSPINYILDLKNYFNEEYIYPFDVSKYKGEWYINNRLIEIIKVLLEFGAIVSVSEIRYIKATNQSVRRNGYDYKKKVLINFENDCLYHALNSRYFNEAKFLSDFYPDRLKFLKLFKSQCSSEVKTMEDSDDEYDSKRYNNLKRIIEIIECFIHDIKFTGTQMLEEYTNYSQQINNQIHHNYLLSQIHTELIGKKQNALPPRYIINNNNLNTAPPNNPPSYSATQAETPSFFQGSRDNSDGNLPTYAEIELQAIRNAAAIQPSPSIHGGYRRKNKKSRKNIKRKRSKRIFSKRRVIK